MSSGKKQNQSQKRRSQRAFQAKRDEQETEDYWPYYQQGLHWTKYRECDLAINCFNQVLLLNPKLVDAFFQRGFMYYYRGALQGGDASDLDLAVNDFDRTLQLDPQNINAYYYRVIANNRRGQFDAVIADCQAVLQQWPDQQNGQFYVYMAYAYQVKGNYDQANEAATEAIASYPDYSERYEARCRIHLQKGDYAAALADARHMVELSPDYYRAYLTCGDVRFVEGKFADAIPYYQKAIALAPHQTELKLKLSELLQRNDY